jgi:hypothetical protein
VAKIPCSQCRQRGTLWLGGGDYLECPDCDGRGYIEVQEHRVQARTRKIFIPGQPAFEVVDLPARSLVTDSLIRRS